MSRFGRVLYDNPHLIKYGALKRVPTGELEKSLVIRQLPSEAIRQDIIYHKLLRWCLKNKAELVSVYITDGKRSKDFYERTHYHAIVIVDDSRVRLFYDFHSKEGKPHERGWTIHYYYDSTHDLGLDLANDRRRV